MLNLNEFESLNNEFGLTTEQAQQLIDEIRSIQHKNLELVSLLNHVGSLTHDSLTRLEIRKYFERQAGAQ